MISPLASVAKEAKIGSNVTIHPFAYIEGDVEIGDNCEIMPFASVLNGTRLGSNNRIFQSAVLGAEPQDFAYKGDKDTNLIIGNDNTIRENVVIARATHTGNATRIGNGNSIMEKTHICHDVQIADHCVLGIGSTISGDSIIDSNVILSSLAVIYQGSHVGQWSFIRGGCRITKDVPPYIVMSGNPATYHGVNFAVMSKAGFSEKIERHLSTAYRLIYQTNFSLQDALLKIHDQVPPSIEIDNLTNFINASKQGIVR